MNSPNNSQGAQPPKLLDQLAAKVRLLHYSKRTEKAYVDWVRRFILFHKIRHPREMGAAEVEAFLTHLAVEGHVSASTQNQAFAALLFLYRNVLEIELANVNALARRPERLPVVLSIEEVRQILEELDGMDLLLTELLYGTGMRILECCRLRVKDVDFARRQILVRDAGTWVPALKTTENLGFLQIRATHEELGTWIQGSCGRVGSFISPLELP